MKLFKVQLVVLSNNSTGMKPWKKVTLTHVMWFLFTNPFQVVIAWSVVPDLKGVVPGIRSCTILIAMIVGLAVVPVSETNDGLLSRNICSLSMQTQYWSFIHFKLYKYVNVLSQPFLPLKMTIFNSYESADSTSLLPSGHFQAFSSSTSLSPNQKPLSDIDLEGSWWLFINWVIDTWQHRWYTHTHTFIYFA